MVTVVIRFVAALVGSLAAFFLACHAAAAGGYMSPYALGHVDEFYATIVRPVTSLEPATRKTLGVAAAAIVLQGLLIAALFRKWDRQPAGVYAEPLPVQRVSAEIPERLMAHHHASHEMAYNVGRYDYAGAEERVSVEASVNAVGPSREAIAAVAKLAAKEAGRA